MFDAEEGHPFSKETCFRTASLTFAPCRVSVAMHEAFPTEDPQNEKQYRI
jgi:hypothetical protein